MLAITFAVILGFIIIMYVLLDGFDLGVGILFPFTRNEKERDLLMNSVAPVWDGNETWLVFGGAMLYGAFPMVYGMLLPVLYMPIMLMLIGLIFRGVSFEFRFKADKSKSLWNWIFSLSSTAVAFFQGIILGAFVQGFPVNESAREIAAVDWLTPFSLLTGFALVCGYGLLGACWLVIKTQGALQRRIRHHARGFLILVTLFLIIVSVWTPLHDPDVFHRWYSFPNIILLMPLPLLTILFIYLAWQSLSSTQEIRPLIYSNMIFFCAYAGIGISVYPYLIPYEVTIWEAAAPDMTLKFILVGVCLMLPVLIAYTAYAYRIFWGKSESGYH